VKDIKHLVGDRVRTLRKGKGLSQEDLGEKADLHYTYIGAVERGEKNASLDTLNKIAAGLEVEVAEFFSYPSDLTNLNKMKRSIIDGLGKCSPDVVKILSDLVWTLSVQRKNKK